MDTLKAILRENSFTHESLPDSGDVLIELDGPQDLTSLSELRQRLAESLLPFETAILRINFAKDLPIEQVVESDS